MDPLDFDQILSRAYYRATWHGDREAAVSELRAALDTETLRAAARERLASLATDRTSSYRRITHDLLRDALAPVELAA
jgi:hypothetical protein